MGLVGPGGNSIPDPSDKVQTFAYLLWSNWWVSVLVFDPDHTDTYLLG